MYRYDIYLSIHSKRGHFMETGDLFSWKDMRSAFHRALAENLIWPENGYFSETSLFYVRNIKEDHQTWHGSPPGMAPYTCVYDHPIWPLRARGQRSKRGQTNKNHKITDKMVSAKMFQLSEKWRYLYQLRLKLLHKLQATTFVLPPSWFGYFMYTCHPIFWKFSIFFIEKS